MSRDAITTWGELVAYLLVVAIMIGMVVGATYGCNAWRCSSRWDGSGMKTSWGPMKGCQLEAKPGKWVPADRYRETD